MRNSINFNPKTADDQSTDKSPDEMRPTTLSTIDKTINMQVKNINETNVQILIEDKFKQDSSANPTQDSAPATIEKSKEDPSEAVPDKP